MSAETKKEIALEIAHVLFIDIVGYSKLSINEQRGAVDELTQIVRATEQFQNAEAAARLIKIPTGDGMALVFYTSPEAPAQCAIEISQALKKHRTQVRWAEAAIALLVLGAVVAAFVLVLRRPVRSTVASPEKSIAVLPFENLTRDPDNAYFAAGIQDEILTRLAKIGALKVISHASTQQYPARPSNLPEIARQLGVANILEGSVQKVADLVHINVQLIHAATDEHLWAESYDRKVENIFGVEAEVATSVAEALKANLTGATQRKLKEKPTNNPEAYDAYLRGLAYSLRLAYYPEDYRTAIKHFGEAVKLDPKFALAWAWFARENALGYFNRIENDFQALRDAAKRAADRAIELRPDLGEAYLAQGYSQYYGDQ